VRTCVIYNPAAGRGRARRLREEVRRAFAGETAFEATTGPGHALEIGERAARSGFDRVAAAGGDGTVHEVARGILASGYRETLFSTIPVGSMNDYAFATGMLGWWKNGRTAPLDSIRADVGLIRARSRERHFVNGCGIGFNGMVTVESTKIRSLRGLPLYAFALLRALAFHYAKPVMALQIDDLEIVGPTLALSVNLGQREGGFPLTRDARLDDGRFDTVHAAAVKPWEMIRYLPAMISGKLPKEHPQLRLGHCTRVRVSCERDLCIHTDGELFAVPGDGVKEVEIELLPGLLRVETCPTFQYGRKRSS